MGCRVTRGIATALLAAALLACASGEARAAEMAPPAPVHKKRQKGKPESVASWHARRSLFFQRNWGVDIVGIRRVSSGLMLRFDYRVVDPQRAAALNDKKVKPYVIDEATGTALAVPAMENIGELRQVAPAQANRTYFIIFGNPGGLVKRGGRVTLVIGSLRAEGIVVD
jgi:hypothetical protein